MPENIAKLLTRRPRLIAMLTVLSLLPALIGYAATRINYDILTYLPQELESAQGINLLEEPFHMAATSMLIVEDMPAAYTNDLRNAVAKVPGVSNAVWLSSLVGIQLPTDMLPESLRSMFYSGKSTMMLIQYDKAGASEETMSAIRQIRSLCNERCFLAGFSVVIEDTMELVNRELPVFIALAVALALAAMALTMESTVLPIVLMANICIAVLFNFGSNVLLGEISYITKAIAAVLQLGVTMDYSVFLYRRYEQERPKYEEPRDAMACAVTAAFRSLASSCLTTVAGFLALCFMRLTLGRDIGIVMAKGVLLGVLTVIVVMPSIVLLCTDAIEKHRHRTILPDFSGLNHFVLRHRKAFTVLTLLLFVPSLYAESHASIYYKLDESLPQSLPSIVANRKLKDEFDMATSHFVLLRDDLSAADMSELETQMKNITGVTGLVSCHSLMGVGIPDFFIPADIRDMLRQGGRQLVMVNTEYETASDEVSRQLDEITSLVKRCDESALITGEAAMTDDLIDTTAVDFRVTNYISIAAIFLIIALAFKSISVPVVLVAAIELAILINQGVPYFTGAEVPFVAPTVISCVQLGATVDYAILMTSRFQEELRLGKNRYDAAHIAATASDGSIITSASVLLCATLGVSFISSIDMISALCLMLARGAVISVLVIILLLPPLLYVCEPVFRRTSLHWSSVK